MIARESTYIVTVTMIKILWSIIVDETGSEWLLLEE